jgi:hypothetical protein
MNSQRGRGLALALSRFELLSCRYLRHPTSTTNSQDEQEQQQIQSDLEPDSIVEDDSEDKVI